jgi:hypothetical protein
MPLDRIRNTLLGTNYGEVDAEKIGKQFTALGKKQEAYFGGGLGSLYQALGEQKGAYSKAKQTVADQNLSAYQQSAGRADAGDRASRASLAQRGLSDASTEAMLARGRANARSNALASLNAQFSQLGSNVKISEGRGVGGAFTDIANLHMRRAGQIVSSAAAHASLVNGLQQGRHGGIVAPIVRIIAAYYTSGMSEKAFSQSGEQSGPNSGGYAQGQGQTPGQNSYGMPYQDPNYTG